MKKVKNWNAQAVISVAQSVPTRLVTYEWNFKKFTSQDRLNDLSRYGFIACSVTPTEYGAYYSYSTLDGRFIAKFYKDSSFGFCSQATGIELRNVTDLGTIN